MGKWKLTLVLCLAATVCQAQTSDYRTYVRRALESMSADSTEKAERLFREAMRI